MLANPTKSNKRDELQCIHGVIRWNCAKNDLVVSDGIIPVVDYYRVFVNGRLIGKTKTMSYCLKRSEISDRRSDVEKTGKTHSYVVLIQPVTIFGTSIPLQQCTPFTLSFSPVYSLLVTNTTLSLWEETSLCRSQNVFSLHRNQIDHISH